MCLAGKQKGFSLLEVLVALFILSTGLIGLAGLQLQGIKEGRDAYYRTQAILLSSSISEQMRTNTGAVQAGHYQLASSQFTMSCYTVTGCTAVELAGHELALWQQIVSERLPTGGAVVCRDSTPQDGSGVMAAACDASGNGYVAKIWWDDDQDTATDQQRLSMPFIP